MEDNLDVWKPLIDIVNGCSNRWRTFVVDVPDFVLPYIVGNGGPTSILKCLKVGPDFSFERPSIGFSLTNSLPMPSELVLSAMPLRSIDIGWSNLTAVGINDFYVNECLVLLRWAPRLVTFAINGLRPGQDKILLAPATTTHNTLERLAIFGIGEKQTAQQLLDLLILPSLVDLSYDSRPNPLENVSAFLQRSCCRLTVLRVINRDHDHFSKMAPASGLQALENLEYHGYLDDCLHCLNRATNGGDGSIFFPSLRRLAIWDEPKNWSGLADLFLSRPLKTLSIHPVLNTNPMHKNTWVDKETALRFQDLVEKGHNIKIMVHSMGNREARDLLPWFIEFRMSENRMVD